MQNLFFSAAAAHRRGEDLALCTVIEQAGSAPRGIGAMMAVFADGSTAGTVGGGAIEFLTIRAAKAALSDGLARTEYYTLTPNEAADIGMICGGSAAVRISPIAGTDADFSRLLDEIAVRFARHTGSHLLLTMQAAADRFDLIGAEHPAPAGLPAPLPKQPVLLPEDAGGVRRFLLPLVHTETVYLFGGGHVACALAPLLSGVDFSVVVYEDREEFCRKDRFPTAAATVLGDFSRICSHITVTERDFLVIMTRGHQADYAVLSQALRSPAQYIGVIGSRKKVAATRERLLADGFTESDLARIHSPIGLPILAETPAEIAVSIAAEMIEVRARGRM